MFMQDAKTFVAAEPVSGAGFAREPAFNGTGLVSTTLVESDQGWVMAGTLQKGNLVQTFDGGLRAITWLERRPLPRLLSSALIHVPGGALNSCSDLWLLPDQAVLITDPLVSEVFDCAGALVLARDLQGYQGIAHRAFAGQAELIRLGFAQEELIYANSGALIHAPATIARRGGFFPRLNSHQAHAMLALIEAGRPCFARAA